MCLFPIAGWLLAAPVAERFESTFMMLTSVGQLTGLVGVVLFALTLILSARLSFLEDYFGGLDRLYNVHHITGTIAFICLSFHPLMLAARELSFSTYDAALFLLPSSNWPKNFGIISFLLLMALLCVTFYATWRYHLRKFLHQFLGLAFFIGALHGFLMPGTLSSTLWLMWPVLFLCSLGVFAFLYRTLFGKVLVHRYRYTVSAVNRLDDTITEIVMWPKQESMHYESGQFIFISFKHGGIKSETHPFSISSASHEKVLRVTVKALGDYTTSLKDLRVGAEARIEGPFGAFSYIHGFNLNQIWVAGGIGITPFLSMARHLFANTHTGHHVDFYYSTRTKQEMIFLPELEKIAAAYPQFRVIPFNADEKGFISMDAIQNHSTEIMGKDIYVCGPPPMMHSIVGQCRTKGIPSRFVHCEEFKLL
jgi:predicted ferric reductase